MALGRRTQEQNNDPLVQLILSESEAQTLALMCKSIEGSKIKSRRVHTESILGVLRVVGVLAPPRDEAHGFVHFLVNKNFDRIYNGPAILPII